MGQFIKILIKYLFRAVVLPLVTLLIALIVILNLIPQAEIRGYAAREVGKRIGRQIEIGPMHFGWRGLTVASLKLSDGPSFHSGVLFTAKGLRLGWDLRSLWEGLDVRKKFITRSNGRFHIEEFRNPHYTARDFSIRWSLTDMDPSWSHLNGWAKLEQGAGILENIDKLMATSPSMKIVLSPVLAIMNLEKLGILQLGLPDLRHWPIEGVHGSYLFTNGRMTIERFTIDSPLLAMGTTGTVELGSGALQLDAELHSPRKVANALDVKMRVSGTIAHPKVDMDSLKKKAFKATIKRLLENPRDGKKDIDKALKNLFH